MFKNKTLLWIGLIFLVLVLLVLATGYKSTAPAPTTPTPTQTPKENGAISKVIDVVAFIKNYLNEKYEWDDRVAVAGVVMEVEEFLPPGAKDYSFVVIEVTLGPIYTTKDRSQYVVVAEFPKIEYPLAIKLAEKLEALKGKEVIISGVMHRASPGYRTKIFLRDSALLKEAP